MNGTLFLTQAGELALQAAGLPGLTNLKADACTVTPTPPDRQAVIGDFTVPSYTGYTQATVTLTGGFVQGANGPAFALTGEVKFVGPSAGAGVDVTGILLSDGTAHTPWAFIKFDGPLALQAATDVVAVVLKLYANLTSVVDIVS